MSLTNGVFEVQTTGDDALNAGYFAPTGSGAGTDYSLLSPLSCTDLAIDATLNTKVSSASIGFTSAHQRNGLRITAGAGFTTGLYEITAVSAGVATLDRACGTTSSTGGTARVGGAMASPGQVYALVAGITLSGVTSAWLRSGTYSLSTTANVAGGRLDDLNAANLQWTGYGTTRGDYATRPVLRCGASSVTIWTNEGIGGALLDFIEFDGNAQATSRGILSAGGSLLRVLRCKFGGFTNSAVILSSNSIFELVGCEVTGCTTAIPVNLTGSSNVLMMGCAVHDNTGGGVNLGSSNQAIDSASSGNTGAGWIAVAGCRLIGLTSYGNSGRGFDFQAGTNQGTNLISYGNTSYGYGSSTGTPARSSLRNCAGGGNLGNVESTLSTSARYLVEGFVSLTANPFTNAAGLDFTPNGVAGGGAPLRGTGYPQSLPGLSTLAYPDLGPVQHRSPGHAR